VNTLIIGVLLLSLNVLPIAACAQAAQPAKSELQELASSLSGTWKLKVKFEPTSDSPHGIEGSGEETWHLTPGNLMLIDEETVTAEPVKMQLVGLFWNDGVSHQLRALDCNNQNQHTCDLKDAKDGIVVRWNGQELIVEEPESSGGKPMISRVVWSKITPESFLEEGYIGPPGGPFKRGMTIQAFRK
jgi:hypothetical protein